MIATCEQKFVGRSAILPDLKPLSANPTKWSNTLKQFAGFCRELFECVRPFCEVSA